MSKTWIKQSFEIALKGALMAAALFFIINRLEDTQYEGLFSYSWHLAPVYIPLFFILWGLNLWLDAVIWKSVNRFVGDISIKRAFKTNLVCYALSFITPANSGEVAGRYIMLNQNNDRRKTLFLIFWSHFPRMMVKIILGCTALLILVVLTGRVEAQWVYPVIAIGIPAILVFYFLFIRIQHWLHERNIRRIDLANYILNDRPYFSEKIRLLLLALLKYLTYNLQFLVLILMWGNIGFSTELFLSILVFYFVSAVIPTFAAADFLVKAALALYVFQATLADESLLINASFVIWTFNIAIPALVGMGIILRANLMTSIRKKLSRGSLYGPSR